MKVFHYRRSVADHLQTSLLPIGFVPTMGALHEGHLDLVRTAKKDKTYCVVSIFVNPRQFNNPEDLTKYPRKIASDLAALQGAGADAVFIPNATEIFENKISISLDISPLDSVLEGFYRPGHFQGVIDVLHAFFGAIRPNKVYFGQKDLQQCMVVEKMIATHFPQIEQQNCPTRREDSGLAMSSRNSRLSPKGLETASLIYKVLLSLSNSSDFQKDKANSVKLLLDNSIETEYLELIALPDMLSITEKKAVQRAAVVFAGYLEGVRLIDNVLL